MKSSAATSTSPLSLNAIYLNHDVKEGVLTTYGKVVNHLLETYATENIIEETQSDIALFVKPWRRGPLECSNEL